MAAGDSIRLAGRRAWHAAARNCREVRGTIQRVLSSPAGGGGLVVLDDVFPDPLSPFRMAEYNSYLTTLPASQVLTLGRSIVGKVGGFEESMSGYECRYPHLRDRVFRVHPSRSLRGDLAYMVFLNNCVMFLDAIEKSRLPFAFTLYPGGGFRLDDNESDMKLRRVCRSQWFRKLLVTQNVSRDYVTSKEFCDPGLIKFAYGCVLPAAPLQPDEPIKSHYGEGKSNLDVCFVAHKYMPGGLDKGYDVFLEAARAVSLRTRDVRFHVVGGFSEVDGDVTGLADRISFHGPQEAAFFRRFYAEMDIILSPNVAFTLAPGAFDGFPTASCIEAGLNGVAVLATDPLRLNDYFRDGEELIVVSRETKAICERILDLRADHAALRQLAIRGQAAFRRVFDLEAQMAPRFRMLNESLRGAVIAG